ncbi:MAG TPA: hypothetical protein VMH80_13490 [Bryobacteraceae bacterium]|nr:hypothetical protein [Bryobacteraceae bacterium]
MAVSDAIRPAINRTITLKLLLALTVLTSNAAAQWLGYHAPGTPRLRDGSPNLAAPAPRTSDGKPDLSGVWHVEPTSLAEMKQLFGADVATLDVPGMEADTISKYAVNILLDFKSDDVPMRPETAALLRSRRGYLGGCTPIGIPLTYLVSEPDEIVQAPRQIVMMFESDGSHRQIHTDGRPLPTDPEPTWLGYSVGKWEGDTLVVETTGFNDRTALDLMGHPHGEDLRVVERYHRRDFGHMDVEVTLDDPKMYTRPFSIKFTQRLLADSDVLENICSENEKDLSHIGRN